MSDDYDFDDSFDASFLREVDNIAATAITTAKSSGGTTGISRTASHPVTSFNKGWTGHQRSVSSASSSRPPPPRAPPPLPFQKQPTAPTSGGDAGVPLSPRSKGALARRQALLGLSAQPSILPFKPVPRPVGPTSSRTVSAPVPPTYPAASSSRLGRTSSGATGFQTHLNFRKENQTTKGKIWDRTAFAATGRKKLTKNKGALDAQKKRKRGEAFDDEDDEDEMDGEEDDWGEPLAPDPKSKLDLGKAYDPPKHLPDLEATKTYIYPTNRSKRDYQYEIVMACFTDNCLVALPTGLGKTFVAGVVMLNFYRWFPTGKIVFLAPTKPLVNQQIEACQLACGIPSKDAAVMTGASVSAKERAKLWQERRVFYCTPQTMYNDLTSGRLDPRDIVLAVFDEAHKASGSYAYTTILAYLTAHQPHFRVLALTATPGADVPKVQGVVDALHISRIEIREAEDPAISKYMNEKHVVPMSEVIEGFRDRWAVLMRPMVQKLVDKGVLMDRDLDTKRLKPFRLTARRMEINRDRTSGFRWALGTLQSLEAMARAMTHLLEFSIGMFRQSLLEISGTTSQETGKKTGSKGTSNALKNNFEFQKLLRDVETEMNLMKIGVGGRGRSDAHPKMGKTLELLLAHFTQAQEDEDVHGVKNDTRAMVFCSFRHCVLEVVDMLNDHPDLLKATKFVGQSQGKQENDKGFNQKEQKKVSSSVTFTMLAADLQTIADFKEGKHNILVSTSIGEEGLDIGEVDFVIIYDMPKQSIKLLQRIGRTGRKRSGQVHVLMSENREDSNWDSAQQTHREIQEEILHSRNLELFEDVERLLPAGLFPKCEEKEMPVDPWDPEDQKRKIPAASAISKSKTKEKDEPLQRGDAIPEGAANGFRSVAELMRDQGRAIGATGKLKGKGMATTTGKGKGAGRKRKLPSPVRSESEDDGVVEDPELLFGPMKVAGRAPAKKTKVAAKPKEGTAAAKKGKAVKAKKGKAAREEEMEDEEPEEDPDDPKVIQRKKEEKARQRERSLDRMGLDFFNTIGPTRLGASTPDTTPPSSPPVPLSKIVQRATHPPASPKTDESDRAARNGGSAGGGPSRLSPTIAALAGFSQIDPIDFSWNESDDESGLPAVKTQEMKVADEDETLVPSGAPVRRIGLSKSRPASQISKPVNVPLGPTKSTLAMPPPAFPHHRTSSPGGPPVDSPAIDPTQFPIRKLGARRARVVLSSSEKDSAPGTGVAREMSSPLAPIRPNGVASAQQLACDPASSPVMHRPKARGKGRVPRAEVQKYIDQDVQISGSESSDEGSPAEEDESDRLFAGRNFDPTQAPKGYNQRAMYLAGLSTQAGRTAGLGFRKRVDEEGFLAKARRPVLLTDDESEGGGGRGAADGTSSPNEYEMGSFVVQDDEDLGFEDGVGEESF